MLLIWEEKFGLAVSAGNESEDEYLRAKFMNKKM
jgi:hypothetical protein